MNDSIIKTNKPPIGGLRRGIMANKAEFDNHISTIDPTKVENRIGLVLDDSGSMGQSGMEDAHKAVYGFTQNCNMKDTSIAIYPLNVGFKPLICDYDILNAYVSGIWATGNTPIYTKLSELIEKESITRGVLFSDGKPTDSNILEKEKETNEDFYYGFKDSKLAKETLDKYIKKEIPIDTIFIGLEATKGYREMKKIAELTNGTFIHFKDTTSLSTGLKYLAPKYRALLMNPEIKQRIERGENV